MSTAPNDLAGGEDIYAIRVALGLAQGGAQLTANYATNILALIDHQEHARDETYESFCEMERERDAALRELDRLNGPVCPFDHKRASEHNRMSGAELGVGPDICVGGKTKCGTLAVHNLMAGSGRHPHNWTPVARKHPPAPEIETWLAERSAK